MPYKVAPEIITIALSEAIQTFHGKSVAEFRRNFTQAREEYEKHAKGKEELKINGERITSEKLSKVLGKCHTIPNSALEIEVVNYYDPMVRRVLSKMPRNARRAIRNLLTILENIPGAKIPTCPKEVSEWLEKDK